MERRKSISKTVILIGILLLFMSMTLYLIPSIVEIKERHHEEERIEEYIENTSLNSDEKIEQAEYFAILETPKININKGLYSLNSNYNNVEYNIQIIDGSIMPDENDSILILAGHNGNSRVSYFKNLDRLEKNDVVYIYYNGLRYKYLIDHFFITEKDGNIELRKEKGKKILILTTCIRNEMKQLVYVSYLNEITGY